MLTILLAISVVINAIQLIYIIIQDGLRTGAIFKERLWKRLYEEQEKSAQEWEDKYWKEAKIDYQLTKKDHEKGIH